MVLVLIASMVEDIEPFEAVGWNSMLPGNGVDCDNTLLGLPDVKDRDCLEFLFGFLDRKSTRLNSSHVVISYAVFCFKKKIDRKSHTSVSYPSLPYTTH